MTNQEILKKVISKACPFQTKDGLLESIYVVKIENDFVYVQGSRKDEGEGNGSIFRIGLYDLLFNHNFAKAFWGEENIENTDGDYDIRTYNLPAWQAHLVELVLLVIKDVGVHVVEVVLPRVLARRVADKLCEPYGGQLLGGGCGYGASSCRPVSQRAGHCADAGPLDRRTVRRGGSSMCRHQPPGLVPRVLSR